MSSGLTRPDPARPARGRHARTLRHMPFPAYLFRDLFDLEHGGRDAVGGAVRGLDAHRLARVQLDLRAGGRAGGRACVWPYARGTGRLHADPSMQRASPPASPVSTHDNAATGWYALARMPVRLCACQPTRQHRKKGGGGVCVWVCRCWRWGGGVCVFWTLRYRCTQQQPWAAPPPPRPHACTPVTPAHRSPDALMATQTATSAKARRTHAINQARHCAPRPAGGAPHLGRPCLACPRQTDPTRPTRRRRPHL